MSETWCYDEPEIVINGETLNIEPGVLGTPDDVRRHVSVATTTVFLPLGVETKTTLVTNEFFEEAVRYVIVPGAEDVRFEITFAATKEMPAAVKVNGEIVATGTTAGTLVHTRPIAVYA